MVVVVAESPSDESDLGLRSLCVVLCGSLAVSLFFLLPFCLKEVGGEEEEVEEAWACSLVSWNGIFLTLSISALETPSPIVGTGNTYITIGAQTHIHKYTDTYTVSLLLANIYAGLARSTALTRGEYQYIYQAI